MKKLYLGEVVLVFMLELLLNVFEVFESGFHLHNLVFGLVELIPDNIGFL